MNCYEKEEYNNIIRKIALQVFAKSIASGPDEYMTTRDFLIDEASDILDFTFPQSPNLTFILNKVNEIETNGMKISINTESVDFNDCFFQFGVLNDEK